MNKHIKKKFLFEEPKPAGFEGGIPWEKRDEYKNIDKKYTAYVTTDENLIIRTFRYNHEGNVLWIPEPDTVLIYFNSAYMQFIQIKKSRDEVLNKIQTYAYTEDVKNTLYDFFAATSGFIIFLFTSIESFINHNIDKEFVYRRPIGNKRIEEYNKGQIERHINFDEKLNNVLVQATALHFKKNYPTKYIHIDNLKKMRDSIIHTKQYFEEETAFDYLFKRALNFKYMETLDAVKDLFNFYKPGYIEDCACLHNW